MPSLLTLTFLSSLALSVSADRGGGNLHNTPTVCNNVPDEPPSRRFARGLGGISAVQYEKRTTDTVSVSHNSLLGRSLSKRAGTISFDDNCNEPPPEGSSWAKLKTEFPTKKDVIQAAYNDAVTLAKSSQDIAADNKGFSHYFGGEGTDIQHTHFKAMMAAIASDTNYYNVKFECSGSGGDCNKVESAANTDATAGSATDEKNIWICSRFWTAASSRFLITPKEDSSPPYRPKTSSGWCNKDKDGNSVKEAQFFATAGHTILHELTHLDSLAKQAGLDPENGQHGTDDSQDGCELGGARDYLKTYKLPKDQRPDKFKDMPSPDYNAESYAAAATEKYFMDLCEFTEIKPLVTADTPSSPPPPTSNPIPDPKCAGEPTDGPVAFGQPDADAKILEFCGDRRYWGTVVVPAVSVGTGQTSDGRGKALGMSSSWDVNGNGDKLYIGLAFSEGSCTGMFQFDIGNTDEEKINHCADRFRKILNGCNTAGLFPKYGGTLDDVCAVYTLTARKGDAPDPTHLKSQDDVGNFICEKTDTSALGPGSPLENTCTCHYENVPGPFDTFKMPPSGDCKDTNKAELLNN